MWNTGCSTECSVQLSVQHSQVSIQVWWCKWCWWWSLACLPSLVPHQIFLVDCLWQSVCTKRASWTVKEHERAKILQHFLWNCPPQKTVSFNKILPFPGSLRQKICGYTHLQIEGFLFVIKRISNIAKISFHHYDYFAKNNFGSAVEHLSELFQPLTNNLKTWMANSNACCIIIQPTQANDGLSTSIEMFNRILLACRCTK